LLAIEPVGASRILTFPPDASGEATPSSLATLAAARPKTDALPIAGQPRRLVVILDTALATALKSPDPSPVPADWAGITVGVDVIDGDGRLLRIEGGSARFAALGQRVVVPFTTEIGGRSVAIAGPVRLAGIELQIATPGLIAVTGTMTIRGIEASEAAAGETWNGIGFGPNGRWDWVRIDPSSGIVGLPPNGAPETVTVTGSGRGGVGGSIAAPPVVFRLWAPPPDDEILPVVAGSAFLAATGASVGEDLAAHIQGSPVTLRIVGMVESFPTLDPAKPFLIADGETRDFQRLGTVARVLPASESWLSVEPGQATTVAATLARPPFEAAQVVGRDALTVALATDPVPLGVIGVLGLGSIAAMAFAAIGFVVSASVSTDERRGEFALLRALGLSNRQLSLWLALENTFLLVIGLVLGSALGLLLAWLVLPFVTVTGTGAAAVPAPVIVIPWAAIAPIWVLAGLLLLVTVVAVRRQLPSAAIGGVLRAGDG
jgi:hypothetical protein